MTVLRAYRYRLYPTKDQEQKLSQFVGNNRFYWNHVLTSLKNRKWNKNEISKEIPALKKNLPFLKISSSHALQQVLIDMDTAFRKFFKKRGGYPNFKRRWVHDSFRIPVVHAPETVNDESKLWIPKLGFINLRVSRKLKGEARSFTVSRKADRWFVSILVRDKAVEKQKKTGNVIGIDLGITHTATTSKGEFIKSPTERTAILENRIEHLQRRINRAEKKSKNRAKLEIKISKLRMTLLDVRTDFLHKLSARLVKSHDLLVLEHLNIKRMMRPGGKKQKFNRLILNQSWHKLRTFITYKGAWYGCKVKFVPPQYTSMACSECGSISPKNRKTQSLFKCISCGHTENADVNAAKNILTVGQTGRAFGATALAG